MDDGQALVETRGLILANPFFNAHFPNLAIAIANGVVPLHMLENMVRERLVIPVVAEVTLVKAVTRCDLLHS